MIGDVCSIYTIHRNIIEFFIDVNSASSNLKLWASGVSIEGFVCLWRFLTLDMCGSFLLSHNISRNSSAQLDAWTDSEATETTAPWDPLEGAKKRTISSATWLCDRSLHPISLALRPVTCENFTVITVLFFPVEIHTIQLPSDTCTKGPPQGMNYAYWSLASKSPAPISCSSTDVTRMMG